ncbi:putative deoxyhypusine hydroxylase-like [Apostichopus japonicus]|uniref:Deoxyhypusine hydroxylase n=1 Tax=Stichopus japonicus TaxID=307972 RepID=A0A2G8LCJ2_STIJA|nr:putative deoxyhypusine hydroxylase-like [Apostichopus japonicus]
MEVNTQDIAKIGALLNDKHKPLPERFRALFTLRNLGGDVAIQSISRCFQDPSALLKHEVAYCLGQMQDERAIPILVAVLEDGNQETIVRHEAGEALGAIGSQTVLPVLETYLKSEIPEISETCQLAIERIKWLNSAEYESGPMSDNPFSSVDPAPPSSHGSIDEAERKLLDENVSLLRDTGQCLSCSSALFRHEIAYVLGQMQNRVTVPALIKQLANKDEEGMVRHECAEALGSIAEKNCLEALKDFLRDSERVVRESCEVALDMFEYENSSEFQYADGLNKVTNTI